MDLDSNAEPGGNFKRRGLRFEVYRCYSWKGPKVLNTRGYGGESFLCLLLEVRSIVLNSSPSLKRQKPGHEQGSVLPCPQRHRSRANKGNILWRKGPEGLRKTVSSLPTPRTLPACGPYPFSSEPEPCGPTRHQDCGPKKLIVRRGYWETTRNTSQH